MRLEMKKDNQNKQGFLRRILILNFLFFLGVISLSPVQKTRYKRTPFKDGEILSYKVKWGFIRIGTVEISQRIMNLSYSSLYLVQLRAKSSTFKVFLDADSPTSMSFVMEEDKQNGNVKAYLYDKQNHLVLMKTWQNKRLVQNTALSYQDAYYDLLDLMMMMRCLSESGASITLPTIVDSGIKKTYLTFSDDVKNIKVAAVERTIQARQVKGVAGWKAWGGLSGPFEGWFSDDEAAIPLKIQLRVSLGSITLELERVHRPDWAVPEAKQILTKTNPER
jgi:hypothetical protein